MAFDFGPRHELVLAVAHELGNHLGGIRLEAHLLCSDLGPRELARASVEIDSMAGRSGALLGLLRPLVVPGERSTAGPSWLGVLDGARRELVDQGTRGVEVVFELTDDAACSAPPVAWLHHLLMAWLGSTLSQLQTREGQKGRIQVSFVPGQSESLIVFEDNAAEEDLSEGAPRRERPLALAIARTLLGELGGHVEASIERQGTDETWTRVVWSVPKEIEGAGGGKGAGEGEGGV